MVIHFSNGIARSLSRPLGLMGFVGVASDVVWALHRFCLQFMDGRWMDYEDLAICSHLFLEHRDSGGSQFLAIPNISCYAADREQLECLSTKRRRKLYSLKTRNSTAILAKFARIKIDWYTWKFLKWTTRILVTKMVVFYLHLLEFNATNRNNNSRSSDFQENRHRCSGW